MTWIQVNHFWNIHKKNMWVRTAVFTTIASWHPWVMCLCSHYLHLYKVLEPWAFSFLMIHGFADLHVFLPPPWFCTLVSLSTLLTLPITLQYFPQLSCARYLPRAPAKLYFSRYGVMLLLLLGFLPIEGMSTNKLTIFLL